MGRRPIMEMIQQLFKLQISLSFYVATLWVLLFLVCPPPPPFYCPFLKPCHYYLSYLPEERANSIRGTCLTNALPLSLSLSLPSVELLAWLPASFCVINIHIVELCAALLVIPAGGGAQPESSRARAVGALFVVGL